jgi:hypothetical protein
VRLAIALVFAFSSCAHVQEARLKPLLDGACFTVAAVHGMPAATLRFTREMRAADPRANYVIDVLELDDAAAPWLRRATWSVDAFGGIDIAWGHHSGWAMDVDLQGDALVGTADEFWDFGPSVAQLQQPIALRRVPCPPEAQAP